MKSTKKQMDEAFREEKAQNEKSEESGTNWQNYYPICPYCGQEIMRVNQYLIPTNKELDFPHHNAMLIKFKRTDCIIVSCPHCRKILGVYDYYV